MDKEQILADLERARDRMDAARVDRDRLVVQALSAGASMAVVARAAGVSRTQVYNIKRRVTGS